MTSRPKLSQLFETGEILVLTAVDGRRIPLWIAKLNSFEVEECNHEGRVARARIMTMLKDRGTPEYDLMLADVERMPIEEIVETLVSEKENEHLIEIFADLRSDKQWSERILAMDDSSEQLAGRDADDGELQHVASLALEYQAEVLRRLDERKTDYREEMAALTDGRLRELARERYTERKGLEAFNIHRGHYEMLAVIRVCQADPDAEKPDHSTCDHGERYLESLEEARHLPDEIREQVLDVYTRLLVPPDRARFTEGPASSSDSSGPASSAEGSEQSGQAETPATPATTSS